MKKYNVVVIFDKDMKKTLDDLSENIAKEMRRLKKEFDDKSLIHQKELEEYSPDRINITEMSEEETIKKIKKLGVFEEQYKEIVETVYNPFLMHLSQMAVDSEWSKTLEAYKSKEIQLLK